MAKTKRFIIIFLVALLVLLFIFGVFSHSTKFKLINPKPDNNIFNGKSEGNLKLVVENLGGNET